MGSLNAEGELEPVSQVATDIVEDVWSKASAFVRQQVREEIRAALDLLQDGVEPQRECKHRHQCHRLGTLWNAEDLLRRALHEIEIQEGAALVNLQK